MLNKLEELLKILRTQTASLLPSIKMPKPKSLSNGPSRLAPKLPGLPAANKKNPIKSAQQTQNPDIKDIKMKEAQEHLKINKSTGQWSLNKK